MSLKLIGRRAWERWRRRVEVKRAGAGPSDGGLGGPMGDGGRTVQTSPGDQLSWTDISRFQAPRRSCPPMRRTLSPNSVWSLSLKTTWISCTVSTDCETRMQEENKRRSD